MLLPLGKKWDEGDKTLGQTPHYLCVLFFFFNVFGFSHAYVLIVISMSFADVGLEGPMGLAPMAWREGNRELALARSGDNAEEGIAQNLEGLTDGIPDYRGIEEVTVEYQKHTVGVTPRIHRLLR